MAANAVRKQLRDLSHKIGPTLQPVFVSKKLGQHLKPKEIKPSIVNKQCVVRNFLFNILIFFFLYFYVALFYQLLLFSIYRPKLTNIF